MSTRFDENPAMTFQDIKETKRYGRTDRRTDGRTHGRTHTRTHTRTDNVKTVYPPQTKFAGGITRNIFKKDNDEDTEDIFDMSNVRIFKEIEKNGDFYTLLCLRTAELS